MNGDEARRAERERALSGDPKAQDRFRRLSKAMQKVAAMKRPTMSWTAFGELVGASRKDLNSWKTYLRMAEKWSVFPIPSYSMDASGITVHNSNPGGGQASSDAIGNDDVSFRVRAVLPIVYRLITDRTWKQGAFLPHGKISAALLNDTEGAALVSQASAKSGLPEPDVASNMVAWFSQNYTTGKAELENYLERKQIGGRWAYRSLQDTPTGLAPDDDAVFALEGTPLLVSHLKRERRSKLREQKLSEVQANGRRLACEACGFETRRLFPRLGSELLEVHHTVPLGAAAGPVKVTLEDLILLCPTCHRAIHRAGGISLETFRSKYFTRS